MENDLWAMRKIEPDDVFQAMPVIIRQINVEASIYYSKGLVHKDNPEKETPIPECWDTDENIYTKETLKDLWKVVQNYAFDWCVMKINSMK